MSQEQPLREIESENVSDKLNELSQEKTPVASDSAPTATKKETLPAAKNESFAFEKVRKDDRQPVAPGELGGGNENRSGCITIGEALEATALTAGHRPVDYSDAAAIQAAEVRATGRTNIVPGGVAAAAQSAATRNSRITRDEDKTKLGEILSDASSKLPSDKPVTRRDAEGVIGAELRNDPNLCTRPGGVAASVAAAARLNQCNSPTHASNTKKQTDA